MAPKVDAQLLINYQVVDAADEGEMPPLEGAEEDASRMEEVRHGLRGGDRCIEVEATN